jgi:hypothetical protein
VVNPAHGVSWKNKNADQCKRASCHSFYIACYITISVGVAKD